MTQRSVFDWDTKEPTVFALDPYFQAKGTSGMSRGQIASLSRENAEADGKNVATVGGIGRVVIDTVNTRDFHIYRKESK
jgi:hypothetical protein